MKFPKLTDHSSNTLGRMFAIGRFLEATWFFDQFFRAIFGELSLFEVGMKFCVSQGWL